MHQPVHHSSPAQSFACIHSCISHGDVSWWEIGRSMPTGRPFLGLAFCFSGDDSSCHCSQSTLSLQLRDWSPGCLSLSKTLFTTWFDEAQRESCVSAAHWLLCWHIKFPQLHLTYGSLYLLGSWRLFHIQHGVLTFWTLNSIIIFLNSPLSHFLSTRVWISISI